ncbi:hypothetical protein MUP29_12395, partial [bacterium]|nr:hypothetical protein [bacterium]
CGFVPGEGACHSRECSVSADGLRTDRLPGRACRGIEWKLKATDTFQEVGSTNRVIQKLSLPY